MNSSLISIIVPVYQVEDYLEDCIKSLLCQTYENIEILLIDDGSPDGCGRICEEYARKDERVRAVHQKNRGLSGARNTGLRLAAGEYIAFIDSDDLISPVYIEALYGMIVRHHADIAVCDYARNLEDMAEKLSDTRQEICLNAHQMLSKWHGKRKRIETVVWNKIYQKNIFINDTRPILFPEGKEHEDVYVSHLLVQNAGRIAITDQKLYMYQMRGGSIKNQRITEEKAVRNLEAQLARLDFFRENDMKAGSRNLLIGLFLHYLMFSWKLKGRWRPPVRKRELIKYMFDAMM